MVSAGAANKKAFGIDRTTNPWSDMVGTEVIWVAGSNVAECSPITTNYIWQAREQGAKIIVQDPRITPVARTCDLYLPVKPGRDAALFAGVLQIMIERDWLDHEFITDYTVGSSRSPILPRVDAAAHRRRDRRAAAGDRAGRRVVGHGEDQLPVPRARHRAPLERRAERARHDQPGARVRTHRQAEERLRHDRRPGERPRRARARAEVRSAARLARHQQSRAPPLHRRRLGHRRDGAAGPGVDAYELFRKIDRGEIKGLLSICFNPKVSLPDNAFVTRCLEKLEFYAAIDFFLNDTAWHADVVLPGSLHEEDEGTVTQVEGRIIKINKAVDCPGEARQDWRIIQDIARRSAGPGFTFTAAARDLRGAARRQQGRRGGLLGRHLREDHAAARRLLALLQRGPGPARPSSIIRGRRGCSNAAATTRSRKAAARSTSGRARASTSPNIGRRSTMPTRSIRSI